MFCKICYDAERPGYDSHCVRNSFGKVVCPYLLNIKCRTCNQFGHTIKYCKNAASIEYVSVAPVVPVVPVALNKFVAPLNVFMLLCDDDEDDEDDEDDDEWDKLCPISDIVWGVGSVDMIGKSWADAVGA
jgi:hypothetical protein